MIYEQRRIIFVARNIYGTGKQKNGNRNTIQVTSAKT